MDETKLDALVSAYRDEFTRMADLQGAPTPMWDEAVRRTEVARMAVVGRMLEPKSAASLLEAFREFAITPPHEVLDALRRISTADTAELSGASQKGDRPE